jgi:hypothetical protein
LTHHDGSYHGRQALEKEYERTDEAIANYAEAVWTAYPDAFVEVITIDDTGGGSVAVGSSR